MNKLYLILLIAIIANSDAHRSFEEEQEISFNQKMENFLDYVEDHFVYNNIYNDIYYNKADDQAWQKLVDKLYEMVTESEDKGAGEIRKFANKFCTETMNYRISIVIKSCVEFVEKFHSYVD